MPTRACRWISKGSAFRTPRALGLLPITLLVVLLLPALVYAAGERPGTLPDVPELNPNGLNLPPTLAVMLVIDASGSMAGRLEGQTKMEIVKGSLDQIYPQLDHRKIKVGLHAYGFDDSVAKTPEASCPNTALLRAVQTGDVASLRAATGSLEPYGYTPLAASLNAAAQELAKIEATRHVIVLLTDGIETCGGDPAQVAADLHDATAQGVSVSTNVIGFDLDSDGSVELKAIAAAGGGRYFEAANANALGRSLAQAIQVAQKASGNDVRWTPSGTNPATAQPLETGLYALDREIEQGEKGWFKVDTRAGQHVHVRGMNSADATDPKSFALAMYNANSLPIRSRTTTVGDDESPTGTISFLDTAGKGVLFSVGSEEHAIRESPVISLNVRDAWDVQSAFEAPARVSTDSLNVRLHKKLVAHLGDGDHADVFFFDLPVGVARLFLVTDFSRPEFGHTVEIFERNGERIARKFGQGRTRMSIELPAGFHELAVRIADANPRETSRLSRYSFVLTH